jgi:D-alanine--poly(phosphoribitol) ligase subunit 2
MASNDTTLKVKEFVVEEFMPDVPVEELDADFDLLTGGVVDSLGLLKVVAWLETEFNIEVDESELGPESFRTVAAIATFVDQSRETSSAE